MVPTQDVVLVASPAEETRGSIASPLRDRWPVRTAPTLAAALDSLDESIAVVVLDDFDGSSRDLFRTRTDADLSFQVLWLGDPDAPTADYADAVVPSDRIERVAGSTVERLQLRARYDRLLTRFYELAHRRGEPEGESTGEGGRVRTDAELAALKRTLDDLVAELDDEDAFEVALGARRPVDRDR